MIHSHDSDMNMNHKNIIKRKVRKVNNDELSRVTYDKVLIFSCRNE